MLYLLAYVLTAGFVLTGFAILAALGFRDGDRPTDPRAYRLDALTPRAIEREEVDAWRD
jgi:hypothetical protein